MSFELRLTSRADAQAIAALWPLYRRDVAAFDGALPQPHPASGDVPHAAGATAAPAGDSESPGPWWADPTALFPYLILVDGAPAGFNLIAARSKIPATIPADFVVHEFFVVRAHRGTDVAERAALEGFDRHRGLWEVATWPDHPRAIAFWRRVIGKHTSMRFAEDEIDHPWGRRVVFRFDNARQS